MTSKLRVATWNVNSIRMREEQVVSFLRKHQPDCLCLQETKTANDQFPLQRFREAGYRYVHIHGMKAYNGVAVLSRLPIVAVDQYMRVNRQDCRHLSFSIQVKELSRPIEIHNLYVPAGGYEPDMSPGSKFLHKLAFVEEITKWFPENRNPNYPLLMLGDLNIAPLENDVWDHKQLLNVVSHTPIEIEKFKALQESFGWIDAIRYFVPPEEKIYSWWSYRSPDWTRNDRGRRLDHIWVTGALKDYLQSYAILKDVRSWEKPSDHVPVMIDLNLTPVV